MDVTEGVKVNVGDEVGDGVTVSVGVKVGVTVAVSLGEGSGLIVQVGSIVGVGVGVAMSPNPPHPKVNVIARRAVARRSNLLVGDGDCFDPLCGSRNDESTLKSDD